MAPDFDRSGSGADHFEDPPLTPSDTAAPPGQPRPTLISYLVLGLLVVVWPASAFYFLDSQLDLANDVVSPILEIYLPTILVQLLIAGMIVVAMKSEHARGENIGLKNFTRWSVPMAIGFLLIANLALASLQAMIATGSPESFVEFGALLPSTLAEKLTWVLLCAVVAVCEEVTFRGYVMTRMTQIANGRIWLGILVSTLSFASGHLYQGFGGFAIIFVYGLMFCALCLYTGSLYPAMIAHFLQDAMVLFIPESMR